MARSRLAVRQTIRRPTSGKLRAILEDVGTPPAAPFVPAPFQEAALAAVRTGDVLVAAPTGSGKTWIAEQAMAEVLARGGRAWYTTPLKALSNQKFHRFSGLYGLESVGLLTGERRINAQAPIIVATTEILRNALYGVSAAPDLIVLDEAHYLADPERGTAWEEILMLAPRSSRLLLLSATFPNAETVASWLTELRGARPEVIVERLRPVPLRYILADGRGRLIPPDALGHLPPGGRTAGWLPSLLRDLEHYRLLPVILFYPSRRQCDEAARELASLRAFGPELRAAAMARWEKDYPLLRQHPFRNALIDAGIAPHHAGHTTAWRLAVEDLLSRGLIRAVCATTTLASGLDVPARTVALSTLVRNSPEGPVSLTPTEFHQMAGRAGRRGKDTIGIVVLPATSREEAREGLALIDAEPEPVLSAFTPGYVQVLNLLRRCTLREAQQELGRSLAAYERRDEVVRLRQAIASIPPDDLAGRPCDDRLITRGRYERMRDRLARMRRRDAHLPVEELAAQEQELEAWPCARCPVESRCLATIEALRARELRRSALRQALHNVEGSLIDEFTRRAAVLRQLGYLDPEYRLTADGRWAAELRHPRILILAEAVRRSLIGASTAAWAAVGGALATERAPRRGGEAGLQPLARLAKELADLERRQALPADPVVAQFEPEWDPVSRRRLPSPADRRADAVVAWMRGADWMQLSRASQTEEGDLQRVILQAAEVLMQLEGLPFPDVRAAARDARMRLLRPPVI
ncbi:MAG: DEAD/DEAH box helicase [Armatimonadota bacterium]|nr:DEAD/DEAH box helicase [Armatimonadota bacterium]MDR7451821.1 DEAD/DEAH box helicase [Armatimonadota bacterium]MDR7467546.1 DEAD/DEAH box helicase [Armatimonadota bacterium]MDR7494493.1 DEAD/DEAH box helicase [Armatimonadota bacterium]MDR7499754.1 DEAD/DEAH box helicase [Armatimonadota bacterium]